MRLILDIFYLSHERHIFFHSFSASAICWCILSSITTNHLNLTFEVLLKENHMHYTIDLMAYLQFLKLHTKFVRGSPALAQQLRCADTGVNE